MIEATERITVAFESLVAAIHSDGIARLAIALEALAQTDTLFKSGFPSLIDECICDEYDQADGDDQTWECPVHGPVSVITHMAARRKIERLVAEQATEDPEGEKEE